MYVDAYVRQFWDWNIAWIDLTWYIALHLWWSIVGLNFAALFAVMNGWLRWDWNDFVVLFGLVFTLICELFMCGSVRLNKLAEIKGNHVKWRICINVLERQMGSIARWQDGGEPARSDQRCGFDAWLKHVVLYRTVFYACIWRTRQKNGKFVDIICVDYCAKVIMHNNCPLRNYRIVFTKQTENCNSHICYVTK